MRYHIDPKIDCVFKALLGSEGNRCLPIHFRNAALVMNPTSFAVIPAGCRNPGPWTVIMGPCS